MKQLNYNLSHIKQTATKLWNDNNQFKIWAFHAPMGAGKTTFIHALSDVLQVTGSISSPTFALINEYTSAVAGTVYHMDWYRIKDETEAIQSGCEDCIESGNVCFIEWAEKFPGLLSSETLHITIEIINEQERSLIIHLHN